MDKKQSVIWRVINNKKEMLKYVVFFVIIDKVVKENILHEMFSNGGYYEKRTNI